MALLITLHMGLLVWALVGVIEWFAPRVPWPPLSNPLFPPRLLLAHWISILLAASGFLIGCWTRWPHTPHFMVLGYFGMASVCALETFGFLQHSGRFIQMGLEYLSYVAVLLLLFFSDIRKRFEPTLG